VGQAVGCDLQASTQPKLVAERWRYRQSARQQRGGVSLEAGQQLARSNADYSGAAQGRSAFDLEVSSGQYDA
jgi:hypothetical protein